MSFFFCSLYLVNIFSICRNQVERRLAYGKALRYQSRQSIEMVTELELNISNCGENEKKEEMLARDEARKERIRKKQADALLLLQ